MNNHNNTYTQSEENKIINNVRNISEKYHEVLFKIFKVRNLDSFTNFLESKSIKNAINEVVAKAISNPEKILNINIDYAMRFLALMTNTTNKILGENVESIYNPDIKDKRFKDPLWENSAYFDFIKQFYIMSSEWMRSQVEKLDLNPKVQNGVEFYTRQFLDAMCPTNFPMYNPKVLRESIETKYQNIIQGLDNFIKDLEDSSGNIFNINTVDKSFFKVGSNIAATKGKVVLRTRLAELIHYEPIAVVKTIPILIIPPCINKYYILDLRQENSLVKYLVDQGFQVFLLSWANPDATFKDIDFEDYAKLGVLLATDYIKEVCEVGSINALGYCIGGTLLASTVAYLEKIGNDCVKSATYITTLLDFSDPGEIALFINEDTIVDIEKEMDKVGYFDGRYLAYSFSLLRANDLIWSFFVNNYLLGKKPFALDLLFWNSDTSNLPAKMHSFYLRNMYIENNLIIPNKITFLGEKIDLSTISTPSFFLGAKDDHIAPWRSVYKGIRYIGSEKIFCLSTSGHVAGVINPPNSKKYSYWSSVHSCDTFRNSDEWFSAARESEGSWWPYWTQWLIQHSGDNQKEIAYAKSNHLCDAPGTYVVKSSY